MRTPLAAAALALAAHTGAGAQQVANLLDLSLEQLANIEVTSFSKRSQRLADVAGSVYVINSEDIRRSGAVSLTEVLRLAPNLHVARADANQYAISARGFNSVLANKMLVLIDGRTVYSPLFSGVFWEERDLLLDDIERIEVLSGAGGTLYGSNAVNGVINIITRSAAETQGTLLAATAGTKDVALSARHGRTTASGTAYRIYAKRSQRDNTEMGNGTPIRDGSVLNRAGFRMDRTDGPRQWLVQGDIYESRIDQPPATSTRHLHGTNILGRWVQDAAGGSRTQVQMYYAHTERNQPGSVREKLDTVDFDFQHLSRTFKGHELLWGGGYRWQHDDVENISPTLALIPASRRLDLANVFVQDEIALGDSVKLTVGAKAEHNVYTGVEFLPNARIAWNVAPNHLLWAAASRTVRVPSRVDRDFFIPANPPFALVGGSTFQSEVAKVLEGGYRAQPTPALTWSVTLFHHDYDRLRSVDPTPGGATLNNNFEGRLTGVEAWGTYRVSDRWRIHASTVHLREKFTVRPGATPVGGTGQLANDPRSRWTLGSAFDLGSGHEFDVAVRHVGALPVGPVPAYTAIDARWGWNVRPGLNLSLAVRNLGDPRHPEWGTPANRAEIERSVVLKATWRL
ncbi:MAG TPA: TonB-dependent receptor [Ramlibacter sp.]|nr:TonB-dependent receptor [Ramlibacter sp.]